MKRITKYVCLILSAVVTVLLFGTDTKAYAAQNQEMNLYGIYVNSNEKVIPFYWNQRALFTYGPGHVFTHACNLSGT